MVDSHSENRTTTHPFLRSARHDSISGEREPTAETTRSARSDITKSTMASSGGVVKRERWSITKNPDKITNKPVEKKRTSVGKAVDAVKKAFSGARQAASRAARRSRPGRLEVQQSSSVKRLEPAFISVVPKSREVI